MTDETATLIAAGIAAIASAYSAFVTLSGDRSTARETSYRDAAVEDLKALGKAVHETVALTELLASSRTERWKERQEAARRPAVQLKALRLEVRYFLWGIDDGIRTLTRYPDWVSHTKDFPDIREQMTSAGKALGLQIDIAVRDALFSGSYPGFWRRTRVAHASKRLTNIQRAFVGARRK